MTQEQIVQLIKANNLTYPGGMISSDTEILNLRILGDVTSVEALKLLPVSINPQDSKMKVVTLDEVAEVKVSSKDVKSMARSYGKKSLVVSIQKEGTANTAEVSVKVREKLEELERDNDNFDFAISSDQGEIVERSVGNVSSALLYGALFAILVILLFLRSVGATLIVGIAIPFSIVATFVLMYFFDLSLNIMSLDGLALGVGMLVDNAIVVIENIYRHLSLNKTNKEAAIDGSMEVAGALASSTLTTIAVFLPIVFIGGMVGDIFKELALTVTFSLVSSLAVALTVVPTLAGLLIRPGKSKATGENKVYKAIITWALKNRFATLFMAVIVLAGSIYLIPQIGTEFMPGQDEGMFSVSVKLPEGSNLDRTLQVVEELEEKIMMIKEVDVTTSVIGSDGQLALVNAGGEENSASINVKLIDGKERSKTTEEIMKDLKESAASISEKAELTFNISNSMMAMGGNSSAKSTELLRSTTALK